AMQSALARWTPKAPLDFRALIEETAPGSAYLALRFPVLILRGEHAPMPTRLIANHLVSLLPAARRIAIIGGAGHMGPFTHAAAVSNLIVRHIVSADEVVLHPHHMARPTQLSSVPLFVSSREFGIARPSRE